MGRLEIESIPGEGTAFTVFFQGVQPIVSHVVVPPSSVVGHRAGTLLFVDDESALREMGKRVLDNAGYSVLLAKNGREAVEIFQHHSSEIMTVLLDVTMPVMGGIEALRLIREIRPEVPVILMTGFNEDSAREDLDAGIRAEFIQKPYSLGSLVATIKAGIEKQDL